MKDKRTGSRKLAISRGRCPKCDGKMVKGVCTKCHYSSKTAYKSPHEAREFTFAG